jgi:hypothetical protein
LVRWVGWRFLAPTPVRDLPLALYVPDKGDVTLQHFPVAGTVPEAGPNLLSNRI